MTPSKGWANERIELPTQTGNLIVILPGTRPGPRLLFATHLDTVPLCAGAVPVRTSKERITAEGPTALGGDKRPAVSSGVLRGANRGALGTGSDAASAWPPPQEDRKMN